MDRRNPFSSISPQARTFCARVFHMLEVLTEIKPDITARLAKVLLCVASEEGLTGTDICMRTHIDPSVTTRYLKILGAHGGGLGLVRMIPNDRGDRRQKYVVLTPKGVEVIRQMIWAYKRGARAKDARMMAAMLADVVEGSSGIPAKTDTP